MNLKIVFPKLFLQVLISLSCTAITHTAPLGPNRNFVEISCSHTPYPQKCNQFLSKRNVEFQNKPQLLAIASLAVSLNETTNARRHLEIFKGPRYYRGINSCLSMLGHSYFSLDGAYKTLKDLSLTSRNFRSGKNKIDQLIKETLGYISTCKKEFSPPSMSGKVKDEVLSNVENLEALIRNSMALINLVTPTKT